MKDNSQFYYRRALSDVMFALKDTGFEYFLYAGTLLGFVRSGDVLPWDYDVDILLHEKHYLDVRKILESEDFKSIKGVQYNRFAQRGRDRTKSLGYYAVMRRLGTKECEEFHRKRGYTKCRETVDFYLYRESRRWPDCIVRPPYEIGFNTQSSRQDDRGLTAEHVNQAISSGAITNLEDWIEWNAVNFDPDALKRGAPEGCLGFDCGPHLRKFSKDMVYPIKDDVMQGFPVKIPNDPHAMLRQIYGKDYMTPKRAWNGDQAFHNFDYVGLGQFLPGSAPDDN